MKALQIILVASAVGSALSGCAKSDTKGLTPAQAEVQAAAVTPAPRLMEPMGQKFFGGGVIAIPYDCPKSLPPQSKDLIYTLTIGKNFDLRDAQNTKTGEKPKETNNHGNRKTRLDLGTDVTPTQPATIEVILADPLMKFMPSALAMRGGDPEAEQIFCHVERVSDTKLAFRTYQTPVGPTYASYNLGIVVMDDKSSGFDLPVFIDPILDNEGIDP